MMPERSSSFGAGGPREYYHAAMRDELGTGTMTITAWAGDADGTDRRSASGTRDVRRGWPRRGLLLAALAAGAGWAIYATGATDSAEAMVRAGGELTRLLRFMALLKAAMATGALVAVWWRLARPATLGWLLTYLATGAAMAAGPVLIWGMAHVGLGSLLLHGGLFATLVALWRDPAVAARLGAMVEARRGGLLSRVNRGG